MTRQLTAKEEKILKQFEINKPKQIEVSQVVLQGPGNFYNVTNFKVYEIPGTNTKLVFGDIRKSIDMEEIQKMIEKQMTKNSENIIENIKETEVKEINGDINETDIKEINDNENIEIIKEINDNENIESIKEINNNDIKVLMEQTNVSYEKAVEVLKQENYDVIKALVELTKK